MTRWIHKLAVEHPILPPEAEILSLEECLEQVLDSLVVRPGLLSPFFLDFPEQLAFFGYLNIHGLLPKWWSIAMIRDEFYPFLPLAERLFELIDLGADGMVERSRLALIDRYRALDTLEWLHVHYVWSGDERGWKGLAARGGVGERPCTAIMALATGISNGKGMELVEPRHLSLYLHLVGHLDSRHPPQDSHVEIVNRVFTRLEGVYSRVASPEQIEHLFTDENLLYPRAEGAPDEDFFPICPFRARVRVPDTTSLSLAFGFADKWPEGVFLATYIHANRSLTFEGGDASSCFSVWRGLDPDKPRGNVWTRTDYSPLRIGADTPPHVQYRGMAHGFASLGHFGPYYTPSRSIAEGAEWEAPSRYGERGIITPFFSLRDPLDPELATVRQNKWAFAPFDETFSDQLPASRRLEIKREEYGYRSRAMVASAMRSFSPATEDFDGYPHWSKRHGVSFSESGIWYPERCERVTRETLGALKRAKYVIREPRASWLFPGALASPPGPRGHGDKGWAHSIFKRVIGPRAVRTAMCPEPGRGTGWEPSTCLWWNSLYAQFGAKAVHRAVARIPVLDDLVHETDILLDTQRIWAGPFTYDLDPIISLWTVEADRDFQTYHYRMLFAAMRTDFGSFFEDTKLSPHSKPGEHELLFMYGKFFDQETTLDPNQVRGHRQALKHFDQNIGKKGPFLASGTRGSRPRSSPYMYEVFIAQLVSTPFYTPERNLSENDDHV